MQRRSIKRRHHLEYQKSVFFQSCRMPCSQAFTELSQKIFNGFRMVDMPWSVTSRSTLTGSVRYSSGQVSALLAWRSWKFRSSSLGQVEGPSSFHTKSSSVQSAILVRFLEDFENKGQAPGCAARDTRLPISRGQIYSYMPTLNIVTTNTE